MKQLFYKVIYERNINWVLRNINKIVHPILPKKIRLPPSGILTIKNSAGPKLKIRTNQTNYLTQLLFWEGDKSFEYTKLFIKLIKKIDVFYDIGANIGFYSLLSNMKNKKARIVGFEPASGPLSYFRENVRINGLK